MVAVAHDLESAPGATERVPDPLKELDPAPEPDDERRGDGTMGPSALTT